MEKHLGKQAIKEFLPMQPGDIYRTYADVSALNEYCGYAPVVSLDEGIAEFVEWYKKYYQLN
jgi:UDP-glucuronate 4-epimerase